MKKIALMSGLLLFVVAGFFSCDRSNNKVEPDFRPLLVVNNAGELAELPIPYVQFGHPAADIAAWEAEYHSVKDEASTENKISYKTNDPKGDNPTRFYLLNEGKLVQSAVTIRHDFAANPGTEILRDSFVALLKKAGFEQIENGRWVREKDKLEFCVSYSDDGSYCSLAYSTAGGKSEPGAFKPLLQLDDQGHLAAIPYPYLDFKAGTHDGAKDWEKPYGSTVIEDTPKRMTFKTNDPKGDNPRRVYAFNEQGGRLTLSAVFLRAEIVLKAATFDINEDFELLLSKAGYKLLLNDPAKGLIAYDNGTLILSIAKLEEEPEKVMIVYKPTSEPNIFDFIPEAKDFPLLEVDPKNMTEENVKAYETRLDLRDLNTKLSDGRKYVFSGRIDKTTKKLIATNFLNVTYDFTKLKPGSELLEGLSVVASSVSFMNLAELLSEPGKKYMKNNGFEFSGTDEMGGVQIGKFRDDTRKWQCNVFDMSTPKAKMLMFSFTKLPKGSGPGPDPVEKIRFFLPCLDWTSKVEVGSAVYKFEENRGFKPEIKTSTSGLNKKFIYAAPPYDRLSEKPGFVSVSYWATSETDQTINSININLSSKQKFTVTDPDIREFFTTNGFEFKQEGKTVVGKPVLYFYDAKRKTELQITDYGSFVGVSFVPLDEWMPYSAEQIRNKSIHTMRYFRAMK